MDCMRIYCRRQIIIFYITLKQIKMKFKETIIFFLGGAMVFGLGYAAGWNVRDIKVKEDKLKCPNCTATQLCPNSLEAIKRLRDYQIQIFNDSTVIWDADRKVSVWAFNSQSLLDSTIMADNE